MTDTTAQPREAVLTANEWMSLLINECVPPGDFRVRDVSGDIWERAVGEDPDLFWQWLQLNGETVIRDAVRKTFSSRRKLFYARARQQDWLDAAAEYHRTGDESVFSPFEVHFAVDEHHTQRRVGDMRGADHQFVAAREQGRSDFASLKAAFHRQVAAVVGTRTTEEAMSEEDFMALFRAIVGHEDRGAPPNV